MAEPMTFMAVFSPDENGWVTAQLAEWPAIVTCGRTTEEARAMLLDAASEMLASYRDEGREAPATPNRSPSTSPLEAPST